MKKVYVACRIPRIAKKEYVLEVDSKMSPETIHELYVNKVERREHYIYNGPWVLRLPKNENEFYQNNLPPNLNATHLWQMVKEKIDSSEILLGIVNTKAFGTIAEIGYASKRKMAVYVLPDEHCSRVEIQDLWLVFQIAKSTKEYWLDEDILMFSEFSNLNIKSVSDYLSYLDGVIPRFIE